jgi:hypothetical protein
MSKVKEGDPREQYLNQGDPDTLLVVHKNFNDEIMTINADSFDPKIHKRCNVHGQLIDEKGVVIGTPKPVANTEPKV